MPPHKEIAFEEEICEHLGAHGWAYETRISARYDRALALFPEDLIAWVQETQPKAWEQLAGAFGAGAEAALCKRLRDGMDTRGVLDVLRNGMEMVPVRGKLVLFQPKPALAMNPELAARYRANRLRVLRQVRYSQANGNSLDLVLFLNGIPVATAELKTDLTQSVEDAVEQYRLDRDPKPKGQTPEPLLSFPGGALVHFAVSNMEARMTTRLEGARTRFLPFNRGTEDHGAGNPPDPEHGYRTAYLWRDVWERESWLDILARYVMPERDEKRQLKGWLFPRFHQLGATRKLLEAVRTGGPGGRYLIQHSAGSGKTKSIAWSAHFLAELHGTVGDAENRKVFDTVLVISDRNVIDKQLQEEIFGFQRTLGVVQVIDGRSSSKSSELAEALSGAKKVVVCTIQTFPALHAKMAELVRREGRRYAVIADEAHSSQTGEAATKLKEVLAAPESETDEVSAEDLLLQQMTARVGIEGITYVAFTATPKAKTLELFGTLPAPEEPAGDGNLPVPFHIYSMRQAIEEEFILDVLRNWTSYKLAFRLAHDGQEYDETTVVRSEATKGIMRWVRLHPYNISQKVQVVVEHFRANVEPLLSGQAKAMVVVGSRLEAVRWQLAVMKYIRERGYGLQALVAFSGEVEDAESGPDKFTETSATLNPNLRGRDIREAFAGPEYRLLLVANKFQTGFDQKLLCGMYIDRKLGGIQAVQTLSRLNRSYEGPLGMKDTTFVLDFVNEPAEILAAFQTYYKTAALGGTSDPNLIYNLRAKLDAAGAYDEFEVERVAAVAMTPGAKQSDLLKALEPVADRLLRRYRQAAERERTAKEIGDEPAAEAAKAEREVLLLLKGDMQTYGSAYTFLSQIFDYGSTDLEKRAIFYKRLLPLLEFGRDRDGIDLSRVMLTHYTLRNRGRETMSLGGGDPALLKPLTDAGSGLVQERERALLAEIIERVNDLFAGELTDGDQLSYVFTIRSKMLESETLIRQAQSNSKEQFSNSPDLDTEQVNAHMDASEAHTVMSRQALDSEQVRQGLKEALLGPAQLYEALRARGVQQTHHAP